MKVLLITEDFMPKPGGVSTFLHNLCLYSEAEIRVLASEVINRSDNFDPHQPYSIFRVRQPRRLGFLNLLNKAYRITSTFQPDVIFWGHATSVAIQAFWLKKRFGAPFAILVHSTEMNMSLHNDWLSRQMVLSSLKGADLIFVNSRYTGHNVRKLKIRSEKISILNPGVNIRQFHPDVDVSDLIQRYNLADKKILLTVSRLVPKKNHVAVLRALPDVLTKVPNAMYLVIGNGPERNNLQLLCGKLDLSDHIIFLPHTTGQDLVKLYNICDLYIMVSKTAQTEKLTGPPIDVESFGISFVEAGACGKPVIGGSSGGIADAVVDGETGLLVDPEDEEAIAEVIIRLLTDEVLARRLGDNGRRRVVEQFSWEKVASRFDDKLDELLMD